MMEVSKIFVEQMEWVKRDRLEKMDVEMNYKNKHKGVGYGRKVRSKVKATKELVEYDIPCELEL